MLVITKLMSDDILQGAPTHKFNWLLIEMIVWDHVTNSIHISTWRKPMNTKQGKVLTYSEVPSLKAHDPLIAWPTYSHYHKTYDQRTQ